MRVRVLIDARAAVRAGGPVLRGSVSVPCDLATWTAREREWLADNVDPRSSEADELAPKPARLLYVALATPDEVRAAVNRWIVREEREARDAVEARERAKARALELTELAVRWLPRDLSQQRRDGLLSDEATREALRDEVLVRVFHEWGFPLARRIRASDLEHEDGCEGDDSWLDLEVVSPSTGAIDLSSGAYQQLLHLRELAERARSQYGAVEANVEPRVRQFRCSRCGAEGASEVASVRLAWESGVAVSGLFVLDGMVGGEDDDGE